MARTKRRTFDDGNRQNMVKTTWRNVVSRKEFANGFRDFVRGRPFYEAYDKLDRYEQWNYERGRHVAALYVTYYRSMCKHAGVFKSVPSYSKAKESLIRLAEIMGYRHEVR